MKDTHAIKLPNSWALTRVGEVCTDIKYGYTASASEERSGPRFLRITDIQNGQVQWASVPYCAIQPEQIPKYALNIGDIVFARTGGTVGKSFLITSVPEESVFASYLIRLSAHAGILPKFLYYFFQSGAYWEQIGIKKGGLQGNVNATTLSSLEFPICAFNEQARIVAKIEQLFSELDNGIENLNTAKAQLLVYRQAVLKHAFEGKLTARWRQQNKDRLVNPDHLLTRIQQVRGVDHLPQTDEHKITVTNSKQGKKATKPTVRKGALTIAPDELAKLPILPAEWRYVRLSEIAEIGSGMSVSKSRLLIDPITVPYLRVANVQRGHLDLSKVTTMKIERDQLSRLELKKWDVLFNEGGDRDKLGRGWIWESQVEPCITQNHVFRASPYLPSVVQAKFISHWGNTFGQNYFLDEGKQTTNLASINKGVLSNFPVPLASPEEQEEIVSVIDEKLTMSEQLEQEVTTALEKLQILKSAILDNAFSGTLVEQDQNDEPASVLLERIRGEKAESENDKKKIRGMIAA
jgi:type I restriction enzyme S subunit